MFNFFKDAAKEFTDTTLKLLQMCLDHPKLMILLILNYIMLPILAREIRKQYWVFECGTFEMTRPVFQNDPLSGFFFYSNNICFLPFKHLNDNVMACHIGNRYLFDVMSPAEGGVIKLLDNPEMTICEQFAKFVAK